MLPSGYEIVWNGARDGPGRGSLFVPPIHPIVEVTPTQPRRWRSSLRAEVLAYLSAIWPASVTHGELAKEMGEDIESIRFARYILEGEGEIERVGFDESCVLVRGHRRPIRFRCYKQAEIEWIQQELF
jgi:predicted transcriptional regulator with HTH domain